MRKSRRVEVASESGLISVSAVLGIAFAVFVVYLLLGALNGDYDHYGSIPIPAENARIELRKGETDVYFAESASKDDVGELIPPADLDLKISSADGESVRVDDRNGDTKSTDDGVAKVIAAVQAPEDGTYIVSVTSAEAAQRPSPKLTFGTSPLGAVVIRFKDVVDELNGTTGIVVLIALGALMLAPRVGRALER